MKSAPPPAARNLEHNVSALRERAKQSLESLVRLYGVTQVAGQAAGTIEAKARDLKRFALFYRDLYGHDDPVEWYPSVTREFVKQLQRNRSLAPASIHRVYSTVRHFARWAHRGPFPFPHGLPTEGVKAPEEPEGAFKGLSRKDQVRLLNAAHTLATKPSRGTNQGVRDSAIVHCLLASALRVSELVGLDIDQYDGRVFTGVLQKGGSRRARVPLNASAREALGSWVSLRGQAPGPLFSTRHGARINRHQVYEIVKRMEAQANAHLPEAERFTVSPHVLRHTRLRRAAEEKGVQFARKLSGHRSDKYIWRYIQPSDQDFELSMDQLD